MAQSNDAVSAANKIFRTHEHRNPERIAQEEGILIIPTPFKKQKGAYKVIERQSIIFINECLSPTIREIVFGHELGHHFLHRKKAIQYGGFQEFNLFDMRNNRMEYEANLFAAQLMLPDDEIKEYIYKGFDVQQIAKAMQSDINLVAIKVSELNRRGCRFREQEYRNDFLK
jgi:Zn-dependent peptidase ImmA (M78 family)